MVNPLRIKNGAAALTIGAHVTLLAACSGSGSSSTDPGPAAAAASVRSAVGVIQNTGRIAANASGTASLPLITVAPMPVATVAVPPGDPVPATTPIPPAPTPPPPSSPPAIDLFAGATLAGDTNRPNNSTFTVGEPIELTFQAAGLPPTKTTSLAVRVVDEFGTEVSWTSLDLRADASGKATAAFAAPTTRLGFFQVEAKLPNGTSVPRLGTRPAGILTYAIVPDPAKRINYGDAGSRFGMQGGFSHAQGNVMAFLGVHYLLEGPAWRGFEPQAAGQFAAQRSTATAKGQVYPFRIANNASSWPTYGIPLVITADGLPDWAMQPGTGTKSWPHMGVLNAAGTDGLPIFAKALAESAAADHSHQSNRYYQMTWEPEMPAGFGGTPEQFVDFYKLSYAAIHKADSKAVVMGPTMFPGDEAVLGRLLSAGLGDYIDAVSMHPYVKFPPETNGLVDNIRRQQQMVTAAKGHAVPFVGTEHGYTSGLTGSLDQALGNVREAIILLGEGFRFDFAFYIADFWQHDASETTNTFGYYWNLNPKITFGTDKIGPKPVVPAFAAMTYWLDGTETDGPISNLKGTQMGYRFHRGGLTILALWDFKAASSTVNLPVTTGSIQLCDWMDNCTTRSSAGTVTIDVGPTPTYVIGQNL